MSVVNVLQYFVLGLITLVLGTPAILLGILLPGLHFKGRLFRIVSKAFSRATLGIFGIRVEAHGLENIDPRRPYVFMSNHASHADSPALVLAIPQPLHFVFKKELARIPVFGWALLALGQIMVDRADRRQSRLSLDAGLSGLSGSNSVLVYPEGSRSRDGLLQPFKKGGFHMALRAGLPIVPVRVSGSREIVAAGTLRVRPGTVRIDLLPPVATEGMSPADLPALVETVRAAILSPESPGDAVATGRAAPDAGGEKLTGNPRMPSGTTGPSGRRREPPRR